MLEYKEVDLELPRFAVATDLPLVDLLKALGIKLAFDDHQANFSGVTAEERLYIGDAIQKAWIGTSENGTEAAAVTVIEMSVVLVHQLDGPLPPKPVIFHADHPFLYLIRDVESGEILFAGRIVKTAA